MFSLFNVFGRSKKRRSQHKKNNRKRRTKRVYKMRGGWGGDASASVPILAYDNDKKYNSMMMKGGFMKGGFMKGGWGSPVMI